MHWEDFSIDEGGIVHDGESAKPNANSQAMREPFRQGQNLQFKHGHIGQIDRVVLSLPHCTGGLKFHC